MKNTKQQVVAGKISQIYVSLFLEVLQISVSFLSHSQAFGATEAMSDRHCIHSKGKVNVRLSADNLVACCHTCGFGCNGGFPGSAWRWWVSHGIVSGGSYGSQQVIIIRKSSFHRIIDLSMYRYAQEMDIRHSI